MSVCLPAKEHTFQPTNKMFSVRGQSLAHEEKKWFSFWKWFYGLENQLNINMCVWLTGIPDDMADGVKIHHTDSLMVYHRGDYSQTYFRGVEPSRSCVVVSALGQASLWNPTKIYFCLPNWKINKHNTELQRTAASTKNTGEISTRGRIFPHTHNFYHFKCLWKKKH